MLHWLLCYWYVPVAICIFICIFIWMFNLYTRISDANNLTDVWRDDSKVQRERADAAEENLVDLDAVLESEQESRQELRTQLTECETERRHLQNMVADMNGIRNAVLAAGKLMQKATKAAGTWGRKSPIIIPPGKEAFIAEEDRVKCAIPSSSPAASGS